MRWETRLPDRPPPYAPPRNTLLNGCWQLRQGNGKWSKACRALCVVRCVWCVAPSALHAAHCALRVVCCPFWDREVLCLVRGALLLDPTVSPIPKQAALAEGLLNEFQGPQVDVLGARWGRQV